MGQFITVMLFPALRDGEATPLSGFPQEGDRGKYLGGKVRKNTLGYSGRFLSSRPGIAQAAPFSVCRVLLPATVLYQNVCLIVAAGYRSPPAPDCR